MVRDFIMFELVKIYDETDKIFFLDFLRIGGGGGICARYLYFYTHEPCLQPQLSPLLRHSWSHDPHFLLFQLPAVQAALTLTALFRSRTTL